MSFDRLGRFAVRRRWWIVAVWLGIIGIALPFAPRAPSALSAGGFILDDLESARARQLLERELGAPPSALVIVYSSPTLTAGTPAWTQAVTDATRDVRDAPHVVDVPAPSAGTAPGLAGRAHRIRHRVPRPPRGRLARRHPGHPATTPSGRRPDGRARWRPGVLRRRPGGLRSGPPPERAGEPAARRSRAAAGLRLGGRGGCPARGRRHGRGHRARRDLRGRQRRRR